MVSSHRLTRLEQGVLLAALMHPWTNACLWVDAVVWFPDLDSHIHRASSDLSAARRPFLVEKWEQQSLCRLLVMSCKGFFMILWSFDFFYLSPWFYLTVLVSKGESKKFCGLLSWAKGSVTTSTQACQPPRFRNCEAALSEPGGRKALVWLQGHMWECTRYRDTELITMAPELKSLERMVESLKL